MLPASLGDAHHLRTDTDASFVESFDCDLVTLSNFTQNVPFGNAAIFQNQFAGARRPDAEFVLLFADSESGKVTFYEERRNTLVSLFRIYIRKHDEKARFDCV